MSDLKRKVANSGSALANRGKREKAITTHKKNIDTTHNVNPTPLRLTLGDISNLDIWVEDCQGSLKKKATRAKLFRALIAIKDEFPEELNKRLIEEIKEL